MSSNCTNLYNFRCTYQLGWVYEFVLPPQGTNLYTLDQKRGIQICTPVFSQIARKFQDLHKVLPIFQANVTCMLRISMQFWHMLPNIKWNFHIITALYIQCITPSFLDCCAGEEKEACNTLFRPCTWAWSATTKQAQRQWAHRLSMYIMSLGFVCQNQPSPKSSVTYT